MARPDPVARIEVSVLVRNDHRHRIDAVAHALTAEGLEVLQVFPVIGVITGRGAPACLDRLHCVEGVEAVQPARSYGLGERGPAL